MRLDVGIAILLFVLCPVAATGVRTDVTGVWAVDLSRSELPQGLTVVHLSMRIERAGKQLTTIEILERPSGTELRRSRYESDSVTHSRVLKLGREFSVTMMPMDRVNALVRGAEKWMLSRDGLELQVRRHGPDGEELLVLVRALEGRPK